MVQNLRELAESFGDNMSYAGPEMVGAIRDSDGNNPVGDRDEAAAGHLTSEMLEDLEETVEGTDMEIVLTEDSYWDDKDVFAVVA